ncbi:hypothetical protein [Jiangella asiatica]|uniref:Uncharacterized protein n=1 Tax=Jiangella asiatica TaxID=2530372 RepID=A0A4V2Z2V6_9ACTN|nr:hypothetical protein [Jiangella asiatica]TDE10388.1 hypothetical protein E1269_11880 [Jiangella asiatica]
MTDAPQQRRNSVLAVMAAVVVVAVAVVLAVWLTGRGDDDDSGAVAVPSADGSGDRSASDDSATPDGSLRTGEPLQLLPSPMGGQEAIDALGEEDLERVAEINNTTVDELRDLLLRDATLLVSPSGRLMYEDTMTPPATSE